MVKLKKNSKIFFLIFCCLKWWFAFHGRFTQKKRLPARFGSIDTKLGSVQLFVSIPEFKIRIACSQDTSESGQVLCATEQNDHFIGRWCVDAMTSPDLGRLHAARRHFVCLFLSRDWNKIIYLKYSGVLFFLDNEMGQNVSLDFS